MEKEQEKLGLLWLLFSFRGRIARQSFALSIVLQLIIVSWTVYQAVISGEDQERLATSGLIIIFTYPFILWSMAAITVKRLHDLNFPAAFVILLFIPAINWLAFLYLMLVRSYRKTNKHGPPPFGSAT